MTRRLAIAASLLLAFSLFALPGCGSSDGNTTPRVRFVNDGNDGTIDGYMHIGAPPANTSGLTPHVQDVLPESTSSYKNEAPGTYNIIVTKANDNTILHQHVHTINSNTDTTVTYKLVPDGLGGFTRTFSINSVDR